MATIKLHRDRFSGIRPWQWWIEDNKGVVHWGGREWTRQDAENAAKAALSCS